MLGSVKRKPCFLPGTLLISLALVLAAFATVRSQDPSPVNGGSGPVVLSLERFNPHNQSTWSIQTIAPKSTVAVSVEAAPPDVRFYVFQAHSYLLNISLSYNETILPHYHVNGTNLGLVWKTNQGSGVFHVFNRNLENVTVMFAIVAYQAYAPVPGGCNMEFDVETAPYLKVWYTDAVIEVNAQPAQVMGNSCTKDLVAHDFYRMYMPERDFSQETYFSSIRAMLTPYDVVANGSLVPVPVYGSAMRRLYSLYSGTGSVYVVLAQSLTGVSAYVPAVSYGCSAVFFGDSCSVLSTTFSKVLCACVLFLGFFCCFMGHSFFKVQIFLAGFLSGSLLSYIGLQNLTTLTFGSGVTLSCLLGLIIASTCLLFWCVCGIPVGAILLIVLPLGFLTASLAFYVGLGDLQFAQLDLDFWLTFLLLMLTVLLLLTPLLHHASIVSAGVVGGYAAVVPFDHYLGGNLKYIIINTLRRASVPGFSLAVIDPPFQATDGFEAALWLLLALIGIRVQQIRQVGRPPFPPARRHALHPTLESGAGPSARTPLRVSSRIPYSYGSVGDDDVFETPPSASAPASAPQTFADWLGRGCGLRGR